MPQNIDDWPALVRARNERPPDGDPDHPMVKRAFQAYVMRLGPLDLPDLRRVSSAIDEVHFENENSPAGPQSCVLVDGGPHAGKTYAALTAAFRETRAIWDGQEPDDALGHRSIPWAYVEALSGAGGYSIMSALGRFLGIPESPRSNAGAVAAKVRAIGSLVGLRGVIIDDSHGLAGFGRGRSESAALANTLKGAVTGLNATVVIVGAGMKRSGVFDNLFGEQIEQRAIWVHVGDWALPVRAVANGPWMQLVAYFNRARVLPDPRKAVELNSRSALNYLASTSRGCPGTAIRWVKRAAVYAIEEGTNLDLAALEATRR